MCNSISDFGIINSDGFTCTSSPQYLVNTRYSRTYSCDRMYDQNSDLGYRTEEGQANETWVDIQFNRAIRISKISLRQTSSTDGQFKELGILFSKGQTQRIFLTDVENKWKSKSISFF